MDNNLKCIGCRRHPAEIPEYVMAAREYAEYSDAADMVRKEEGTLNEETGYFTCTECYIKLGMPTLPGRGWKAGDPL